MSFRFRKTIKAGPVNVNLSKSGVGYSVGAGGVRYTHSPKKENKSNGKKGAWRITAGVFCIIGGLANVADNFGACLFGVALGAALLFWGLKAQKQ